MTAIMLTPTSVAMAMDADTAEMETAASSADELRTLVDDLSVANDALVEDNAVLQQKIDELQRERDDLRDSIGRFDDLYISNYVTTRIKDVLARVNGVSKVNVFGAKDFGMRIWINPDRLRARDLTTVDLIQALREQNAKKLGVHDYTRLMRQSLHAAVISKQLEYKGKANIRDRPGAR